MIRFRIPAALAASALAGVAVLTWQAPVAHAGQGQQASAASRGAQEQAATAYREGQDALRRNDNQRAAALFRSVRTQYAQSPLAQDAPYWEAFALQRLGGQQNLTSAQALLATQARQHPNAPSRTDARALAVRIEGQLAQRGDAQSAQRLAERAESMGQACPSEDEDERLMVLDALLTMDSERALPTLKQVLARRDACSVALRRKAVFLVSRKGSAETEDILLGTLRSDPDAEVREQAVFWLGRTNSEKSTTALIELVTSGQDAELMEKAVFALSQQNTPRAAAALRDVVGNSRLSVEVRGQAIFWLGQRNRGVAESTAYLTELFRTLREDELRERVLFSIAQLKTPATQAFLKTVATNADEPAELRRNAIFHAGQAGLTVPDLLEIYRSTDDAEIREQVIFVVSNKKTPESLDALFEVARNDPDREMRSRAIFWIGQSKDPRAAEFLMRLLEKPPEGK